MAATNSNSSEEPQTFKPFSWLSADAQYLPLASFAARTFDIAQGIGLILEMIEDTQLCEDEEGRSPMLSRGQCGVLQRMVIATADALQSEARQAMDWFDAHRVKYYAPPRRLSGEARTKANTRNLKRLRRRRPSPRRLRDRYSGEKASFPSAGLCQIARDSTDISPSSRTRSRIFFGGGEASLPSSRLKRFQCLSSWPRRHPLTDQEAGSRETAHVPEISVAIFAEPAPRYGEPRE